MDHVIERESPVTNAKEHIAEIRHKLGLDAPKKQNKELEDLVKNLLSM